LDNVVSLQDVAVAIGITEETENALSDKVKKIQGEIGATGAITEGYVKLLAIEHAESFRDGFSMAVRFFRAVEYERLMVEKQSKIDEAAVEARKQLDATLSLAPRL
jgi:hypothetical protein